MGRLAPKFGLTAPKPLMLYRSLKYLADPYILLTILLGGALAVLWYRLRSERRWSLRLAVASYLLLVLAAVPAISFVPLHLIESRFPPLDDEEVPRDVQAIVVLGGGAFAPDSIRRRPELAWTTMTRCLRGADLYQKLGPLPIYVTGDKSLREEPGPPEAEPMRDFLIRLGVKPADIHLEAGSSSTYENALFTCQMLHDAGIHKILLVTEAMHMFRSEGCFRKQGVEVVPAVSSYRTTEFHWKVSKFLPSIYGLAGTSEVFAELTGYAWYWLTGKL